MLGSAMSHGAWPLGTVSVWPIRCNSVGMMRRGGYEGALHGPIENHIIGYPWAMWIERGGGIQSEIY